jgi:hypothetical protein
MSWFNDVVASLNERWILICTVIIFYIKKLCLFIQTTRGAEQCEMEGNIELREIIGLK